VTVRILTGDCRELLASLDAESVQTCITSPPYWGLRDYGLPPLVWGGDHACAHEWGEEGRRHKGGPHGPGVLLDGGRAVVEAQAAVKDIATGAFCSLCGAWRGQLGLEPTPYLFVDHMVEVFRAVHRVLRDDGTLWMNLGDCYATGGGKVGEHPGGGEQGAKWRGEGSKADHPKRSAAGSHTSRHYGEGRPAIGPTTQPNRMPIPGLKPKDLVGIPWRVALALQADGWYLRSDIIWHKPNPMPESITDRPTKAHEYLFLLTKSERYYYDADAIAEPAVTAHEIQWAGETNGMHSGESHAGSAESTRRFKTRSSGNLARKPGSARGCPDGTGSNVAGSVPWEGAVTRNRRSVWTVPTKPYKGAHFATFPPALIEPCVLAGSARQACETCGAAWQRTAEREFVPQEDVSEEKGVRGAGDQKPMDASNTWQGVPRGTTKSHTTGWVPACACETNTGAARSLILDPFGGAATTGLVSDRLGRDAVLLELNPEYAAMGRKRIDDAASHGYQEGFDLSPAVGS
jgi:DNA modification methylase